MSQKTTLSSAQRMPAGFEAFKMHSSPALDIVHLHLVAGEKIPLHTNPVDVVFCILEGSARVQVDGKIENLEKFDVLPVPAGIERGMSNLTETDLRVLVIKQVSKS